jgi:hypothetical protein
VRVSSRLPVAAYAPGEPRAHGDMKARNGWLFPLMVLAAGSVTVFGCIGIAAITGYLPLAKVSATPLGEPLAVHSLELRPTVSPVDPHSSVVLSNAGGGHPDSTARAEDPQEKLPAERKKPTP